MKATGLRQEADSPLVAAKVFEDLTVNLIMEAGDADTNAAAACAVLGAYLGYANLPSQWTEGLAHMEWLLEKTYRLAVVSGVIQDDLEPEADEKANGERGLMRNTELYERNNRIQADIKRARKAAREKSQNA